MTGPTVFVSGASRGLGAATARIAAQMGTNVVLMARSQDDLAVVGAQVEAAGGQALVAVGDVSRAADCQRAVAATVRQFGGVDALVNAAGTIEPIAPIAEADPGAWQQNLAVNLLGPFMLTHAALPHLRRSKGCVVNVSSGAAINVTRGLAAYSAAKAALNHLTRTLAAEEPDVTSIAFRPGVVDTAMQATIRREGTTGMPEEVYARYVRYYQEGSLLLPEVPGCALAVLALHAPHEWSGAFLSWNDEQVRTLVRQFACAPGK